MLDQNISNKLEKNLIFVLKKKKIFKNLKDNFYYLKQNNTLFTYYIDPIINSKDMFCKNEFNILYSENWNILINFSFDDEELLEYENNKYEYFMYSLNSIINNKRLIIPEIYMQFNLIEFQNGIFNLDNGVFINYFAINYIYNEFIQLDIKTFIYTNKNYKVSEQPISFIKMFADKLLMIDEKNITEANKYEVEDLISAIFIFIGYVLKKYGISKLFDFFDSIKKIIGSFVKKDEEEVHNIFNFLFFSLNALIHSNTVNRNSISRLITNNNNLKLLSDFESNKFLSEIYVSNVNFIKSFDLNTISERDIFEFDYINNACYSLRQPNSLLSWLSNIELDNYVILLMHSSMVFNEYVFFFSKIKKNKYLNCLNNELYNEILLSFGKDNNIIECLNNKELLISELKLIIENKENINNCKEILKKLLFLSL